MGRPTLLLWVAVAGCLASGCKPKMSPKPPARVTQTKPRSTLLAEADRVMDAMEDGNVAQIREWMTPELRSRVRLDQLQSASLRLRTHFGNMMGIIEEKVHREGRYRWYSGLVLYGTRAGNGVLTPVLYQFALDDAGALTRLQVREHWFVENLRAPTDAYMPVNRFRFPADGEWTVIHGGPRRATNYHHGSRTQRYAYDIIVKKNGRQKPAGSAKTNNAYYCYGKTLHAPASGVVVRSHNDKPENRPGERGKAGGNGVIIDHGFGEYSHLWHMIPGSVKVKAGDHVEVGQPLGRVGNSGRSTMPHIHFHVQAGDDKRRSVGLPAPFVEVYVNDRWRPRALPVRGDKIEVPKPKKQRKTASARPRILIDA